MTIVASIVEGDGEVAALPVLLRRLGDWRSPGMHVDVSVPIRVRRNRFLNRADEFSRMLQLAAARCGDEGWILILLDADDACPVELASEIGVRATQIVPHRRISVVIANREYEAWFLAATASLEGYRGFSCNDPAEEPDSVRDAKGWIRDRMASRASREVSDQPRFSAMIDLEEAFERSRSFRRLCEEWSRQMDEDREF
jgi:hypothetical protein